MNYIDTILEWSVTDKAPVGFDTKFVLSCKEQFEEKGALSEKQLAALQNIITKFKIGKSKEKIYRKK